MTLIHLCGCALERHDPSRLWVRCPEHGTTETYARAALRNAPVAVAEGPRPSDLTDHCACGELRPAGWLRCYACASGASR